MIETLLMGSFIILLNFKMYLLFVIAFYYLIKLATK